MEPTRLRLSKRHWRTQCLRELGCDGLGLQVLRVRGLNANGRALEGVLDDLRVRRRPALDLPPRDTLSERASERASERERGTGRGTERQSKSEIVWD